MAALAMSAAGMIIVGLQAWVIKTVRDIGQEMSAWRVVLFGHKGDNGINGSVKEILKRMHEHGNVIQAHEFRIDQTEDEVTVLNHRSEEERDRARKRRGQV